MKSITTPLTAILLFFVLIFPTIPAMGENGTPPDKAASPTLKKAVLCEGVQDGLPFNQTIVFDVSKGSAYCWSNFDPVTEEGVIYHKWYRNGELISSFKLAVHPPRWAVYSNLRLRQADTGPWALVIENGDGVVLKTLRFSITE
jgi:hypothetical protein